MLQPVELADFFTVFFSAALVILAGASYALLFAWSRVRNKPRFMYGAYAAYAVLVVAVLLLADAANLSTPFWQVIVALMLIGYWLAPQAIYNLCVGTHGDEN